MRIDQENINDIKYKFFSEEENAWIVVVVV